MRLMVWCRYLENVTSLVKRLFQGLIYTLDITCFLMKEPFKDSDSVNWDKDVLFKPYVPVNPLLYNGSGI
jgi:hypothetical protein